MAQGALLAEVESSSAAASLLEANARLSELKRGSRPEEMTVKQAELAKYTQDLTNTYSGVLDIANDAFTKADDALHLKTAGIFSGSKTSTYKFTFTICDTGLDTTTNLIRLDAENDFDVWRSEIAKRSTNPSNTELAQILETTAPHIEKLKSLFESLNRALTVDCALSNTALDTYRANVNVARNNIITVASNINTKRQTLSSLALTVTKVQNELNLMKAGTASEVIAAQEARVLSAEGDLRKYRISAPINGTVTKVNAIEGETSNTATHAFSIISDSSFEIEAYVPEADIAKVKLADDARTTLDAYGPDTLFKAKVSKIDPAETIIDNVPTYKVTFHFIGNDPRIKSGMTANIDVSTASKTAVLRIPERAVITRNNTKFVRTVTGGTTTDVPVTLGLKGSDGFIEVAGGINEGTMIASSPVE